MNKPLGTLGLALGAALITAVPAGATAGGAGIVHVRHGDATFDLTGADETLVIAGAGAGVLAYTYTVDGTTSSGTVDGFTGDLRILDQGGTDQLTVASLTVPGDLRVETDSGAAQVALGWRNNLPADIQVGGDLRLRTADGLDRVTIAGAIAGSADLRTGGGDDSVILGGFDPGSLPHSVTARSLSIAAGTGADSVMLAAGGTAGATDVDLGPGDDGFRTGVIGRNLQCTSFNPGTDLDVDGRSGSDSITWTCGNAGRDGDLRTGGGDDQVRLGEITGSGVADSRPVAVGRDLTVDLGPGTDSAAALTATAGRDLAVDAGPGPDTVHLGTPSIVPYLFSVGHRATLRLGAGADVLDLRLVTLPAVDLEAAAGNDTVTLTGVSVTGEACLDGGAGADDRLIRDAATTFQQPPTIIRFEG